MTTELELIKQKYDDDYAEVYSLIKSAVEDASLRVAEDGNSNATYVEGYSEDYADAVISRLKVKGWLP